jgi:Cytochrome C oxidase, cbb3-type, subunit III
MLVVNWVVGVSVALLLSVAAPARAQQAPSAVTGSAAEAIEKGKQNFVTYACYACHGYAGQGSDVGPRIDTTRLTLQGFVNFVRMPARRMPPFRTERQISNAALSEIYAFLKSVPPPADPKSIPLLNGN